MDEDRRREIGLFRYALIRDAADPVLSKAERGRLVRQLAEREHSWSIAGRRSCLHSCSGRVRCLAFV